MHRRPGTRAAGSAVADLLWSLVGVALLVAAWAAVHRLAGPFVLPSLAETATALVRLVRAGEVGTALLETGAHALGGVGLGALAGVGLGLAGGLVRPLGTGLAAISTTLLGLPAIAWIVLTLLWFGPGGFGPVVTVMLTTSPIVFAATLQGMRGRDRDLDEMALVFRVPALERLRRILLPELAVGLAPALSSVFALSWKIALTAEVFGDGNGIGGRLATARIHLDLAQTMAWIVVVVALVLVTDVVLFTPLRGWIGRSAAGDGRAGEER